MFRALCLVWVSLSLVAVGAERKKLTPVSEILKRMEASPKQYKIDEHHEDYEQWAQQNLARLYPRGAELEMPKLVKGKLVEDGPPPQVQALLEKIEPDFQAKKYAEAEKAYGEVAKKHPNVYSVLLSWGDAAYFAGNAEVGLQRYQQASKLNPHDFRGWFFQANALFALKRHDEALNAYVRALALRPRRNSVMQALEQRASALKLQISERGFLPYARVEPMADGARIVVGKHHLGWLGWGSCKALWLVESDYRKELTGKAEHIFSSSEERECLAALVGPYATEVEKDPSKKEPQLEHLKRVIEAKLFDGFIVYELASRRNANVFVTLGEDTRAETEAYVKKFVLGVE